MLHRWNLEWFSSNKGLKNDTINIKGTALETETYFLFGHWQYQDPELVDFCQNNLSILIKRAQALKWEVYFWLEAFTNFFLYDLEQYNISKS